MGKQYTQIVASLFGMCVGMFVCPTSFVRLQFGCLTGMAKRMCMICNDPQIPPDLSAGLRALSTLSKQTQVHLIEVKSGCRSGFRESVYTVSCKCTSEKCMLQKLERSRHI